MIDPEFRKMMASTVTIRKATGKDAYGKKILGAPQVYTASVQTGQVRYFDRRTKVEDHTYGGRVYINGWVNVTPDDEVTLPNGKTPHILSTEEWYDDKNQHHTVILFKDSSLI